MSLPDRRLTAVMDKFTDRIKQKQQLCIRRLACNRNEEVQFGRFINNERVAVTDLEASLYTQFRGCCPSSGHVLLLEDCSQMGFSLNRQISGLGKVDKGQIQGFYLHPVLCLDAATGACYGMPSVTFLKREFIQPKPDRKQVRAQRSKIAFEDKEGYRWYSAIEAALKNCPDTINKTMVADREADIYPVLCGLQGLEVDYVVRAHHNRPLQQGNKLFVQSAAFEQQYQFSIAVPATDRRSAHTAVLQVSYGEVELKNPQTKSREPLPLSHICRVVKVTEDSCSVVGKEAPIEWLLLTSHKVDTVEDALTVIEYYKQRWHIEQIFRVLKTKGLCFEASQVKDDTKLKKLMLLALMAAVKVLQLLRARQGHTDQPIGCAFDQPQQVLLGKLNKQLEGKTEKLKNPHQPTSLAFAAWVIARLSGWSGYQSQRPPGPIDFFIGLQRFDERYQGFLISFMT